MFYYNFFFYTYFAKYKKINKKSIKYKAIGKLKKIVVLYMDEFNKNILVLNWIELNSSG